MSDPIYISRKLSNNDSICTEEELLDKYNYIVILAEPGGGKTELMHSFARQLNTDVITANMFSHNGGEWLENSPLLIDAFDELSKTGGTGIYQLFSKAKKINPACVIISSRSSEWSSTSSSTFGEYLGELPQEVKLCEFNEIEQLKIFNKHVPGEKFSTFQEQVARFDLKLLLSNPQFLKLFADAYVESERCFTNKSSIFSQAVNRLAKEVNTSVVNSNPLSIDKKIDLISEVFAKLLLSGAEGVVTCEVPENRMYPLLASLFETNTVAVGILSTRCFKLGDKSDQHRPVHKIVAEYCAANFLIKRIESLSRPFTLQGCLSVIAPNSVVREELRGMLGWMASLGGKSIENAAIELDPYAVLANGDLSLLEDSSKHLLISKLKEIESNDPYFRRGDFGRKFSVAGFFTQDVIDEIKTIFSIGSEGDLCDLVLELLDGSPTTEEFKNELSELVTTLERSKRTRWLASRCLLKMEDYDCHSDLKSLFSEASNTSLNIASEALQKFESKKSNYVYFEDFLQNCTGLYSSHAFESRYFVKDFIKNLHLTDIEWLLDRFTSNLICKCGKKRVKCDCRNGASKIIGIMLDQYFDLVESPFDSKRIFRWLENLHFHEEKKASESKAVQILQECDVLRQWILEHVFRDLTDQKEIGRYKFDSHCHSGLKLYEKDYRFLIDLAFKFNNQNLWVSFIPGHNFYLNKKERENSYNFRKKMRKQALEKSEFMKEWARVNRDFIKSNRRIQKNKALHNRSQRRNSRRKTKRNEKNIKFVQNNREWIKNGEHYGLLEIVSKFLLKSPEKIENELGDEELLRTSLRNCLDFIAPNALSLKELAELHCSSQYASLEIVLYAACLDILRVEGSLEKVDVRLLKGLRTNINMRHSAVSSEKRNALKAELNRLIFSDAESAEKFLREYVEPQLALSECNNPTIYLLEDEAFSHLRETLSIEWLDRFDKLSLNSLNTLFNVAAQYESGNHKKLAKIISSRCIYFMQQWPKKTDNDDIEEKRTFWLIRACYFLDEVPETYWEWLKADKNTIFMFYNISGNIRTGVYPFWPKLTPNMVEAILDAFIDKWPKVELQNIYGTSSSNAENAYRFLTEVIFLLRLDNLRDAIPVIDRLLSDCRFIDFHMNLRSICVEQIRKKALKDFELPTPQEIVKFLDHDSTITVEGLRQRVIQELQDYQKAINGGEFDLVNRFYEKDDRINEVESVKIIAERLNIKLQSQNICVSIEGQLKEAWRCDISVTKMINGKKRLLIIEAKGQWHKELYTAAVTQLYQRYVTHPDAEQQGVYLVLWFGKEVKIANNKKLSIKNAQELKDSIEKKLPPDIRGLIDVFVLDVSKS